MTKERKKKNIYIETLVFIPGERSVLVFRLSPKATFGCYLSSSDVVEVMYDD